VSLLQVIDFQKNQILFQFLCFKRMSFMKFFNDLLETQTSLRLNKRQQREIISLKYPNGHKILSETNPSSVVEVMGILMTFETYGEALEYLSQVQNPINMVLNAPNNKDAVDAVRLKREILSRPAPTAKTGYGKCPKCGDGDLVGNTLQMRSGDEGMTTLVECPVAGCNYRSKR
jgi:DNA-directed RNA polymerase subunit M/transcription elongation factor TFIIS